MVEGFKVSGFGQGVVNRCLVQDSKCQIRPFRRPSKSCHAAPVDTEKPASPRAPYTLESSYGSILKVMRTSFSYQQ